MSIESYTGKGGFTLKAPTTVPTGGVAAGVQLAMFNIAQLAPEVRAWIDTWPQSRKDDLIARAGYVRDTFSFVQFMNGSYLAENQQRAQQAAASSWAPPPSAAAAGPSVKVNQPAPGPAGPAPSAGPAPAKSDLPAGAQLVYFGWEVWAVYTVANNVRVAYRVNGDLTNFSLAGAWQMRSKQELDNYLNSSVVRGPGAEGLANVAKNYGSYSAFFDYILDTTLGKRNPARSDPEVLKIIAMKASRPDMSDQELMRLLQNTEYYQRFTDTQREWNDLSGAEQGLRVNDMAARLAEDYFEKVGVAINFNDPGVQGWARRVASGEIGYGTAIEQYVKAAALQNPESPYSRLIRTEQEQQRQRGVDLENKAEDVRNLAERWGVSMAAGQAQNWAQQIVENRSSDADFLEFLKGQAAVLYPWKDPEIETAQVAQPYVTAYQQTLEKTADITSPDILQALQGGVGLADFQRQLRERPEWTSTNNYQQLASDALAEVGRRFGF